MGFEVAASIIVFVGENFDVASRPKTVVYLELFRLIPHQWTGGACGIEESVAMTERGNSLVT